MKNTIELFMWGFQRHMQICLQVNAESLFNKIDRELNPEIFLLGMLVDDIPGRHPVCLEPEECGFSVTPFLDVDDLAKQLSIAHDANRMFMTDPNSQKNHKNRISASATIEAIQKIIKREDVIGDRDFFISHSTYIEGYLVYVVLKLNKEALNNHYSLTKDKIRDRYSISRSFIESNIEVFLKESASALNMPNRGIGAIDRESDELLREAGKQFMSTVSQAGDSLNGMHGLYDACNTISSLKYEGTDGFGKIIIASKDHQNIRLTLELKDPIRVGDYRKVRKFLELSNNQSIIISDSELIFGLGELTGKYNPKSESLFVINFTSHYTWEVVHDNNIMMVVSYRQPNLPEDRMNRKKFYSDLKRIFSDIDRTQLNNLWDITTEATKQKHGTMLVISDHAQDEAIRLGKQSFALSPLRLNTEVIQQLTSIDGSVLLDQDGICYAIGVILDGLATDKGDSSRGARYNSAIRYYEQFGSKHKMVLIIISEDGMINLIPNLKPQIKKFTINNLIESLEELQYESNVDIKKFNSLMSFFNDHEFYLTQEQCNLINFTRRKIEEKFDTDQIRIIYHDLKPNEEMNESFYT